jgi:hypothetical protein
MTLAINARSEGRVLVPWVHLQYPNSTNQDSSTGLAAMLGGADPGGMYLRIHFIVLPTQLFM